MPAPKKFKDPTKSVIKETLLPPSPKAAKLPLTAMDKDLSSATSPARKYNKDYLKDRWTTLSGRMMDWLNEGDRLETLMAETKLRDLGVMLGIATEKVLLLEGQPTSIIGQAEHKKLEDLIPALMLEVQRRGAKAELTERKATITIAPK